MNLQTKYEINTSAGQRVRIEFFIELILKTFLKILFPLTTHLTCSSPLYLLKILHNEVLLETLSI